MSRWFCHKKGHQIRPLVRFGRKDLFWQLSLLTLWRAQCHDDDDDDDDDYDDNDDGNDDYEDDDDNDEDNDNNDDVASERAAMISDILVTHWTLPLTVGWEQRQSEYCRQR